MENSNIKIDGCYGYKCKYCGYSTLMFLDSRLKLGSTADGKDWQPVPFGIICPHCGRNELYHTNGTQKFELMDLKPNMNYFEYDDSGKLYACGIHKGKDFDSINKVLYFLHDSYEKLHSNENELKLESIKKLEVDKDVKQNS
ncbi:MAG: hypothetical protein NC087_04490 [Anaeroplasma bactoclasticum]|nr:hypothetical protein [Anaeroplasma bactoclasticum]